MREQHKMCTVVDLPTSILASLFATLMFTEIHVNQLPMDIEVFSSQLKLNLNSV